MTAQCEIRCFIQDMLHQEPTIQSQRHREALRALELLIGYLRVPANALTSFCDVDDADVSRFTTYVEQAGKPVSKGVRRTRSPWVLILTQLRSFSYGLYDDRTGYDRDLWSPGLMPASAPRRSSTVSASSMSFREISNQANRDLVKSYIKDLIVHRSMSLSTIYNEQRLSVRLAVWLGDRDITRVERQDAEGYLEFLNSRKLVRDRTFDRAVYAAIRLFDYCVSHGILATNPLDSRDTRHKPLQYKLRTVPWFVIRQILAVLNKIDTMSANIFLLILCTGMRISEACAVKRTGPYLNDGDSYVMFYQQKMRKEVVNPIPRALYDRLMEQSRATAAAFGELEPYMFRTKRTSPIQSATHSVKMKRYCQKFNIRLEDGSQYNYEPHGYRHTMAANMIDHHILFPFIQWVLHHESPDMSAFYGHRGAEHGSREYYDFINVHGKQLEHRLRTEDFLQRIQWLTLNMNAQMLPAGVCMLPVTSASCPHGSACLTCGEFRTDRTFADVLERHRTRTASLIALAQSIKCSRQADTNLQVLKNLESILGRIAKLKRQEGGEQR